jgi:hypothetical protein
MKETGWNHQYHHHCAIYQTVVAESVACLQGNAGWVYCIEADSGKLRWKARLGKVTDVADRFKAEGVVHRSQSWAKMSMNTSPAIADGVVACNDQSGERFASNGLVGFDLRTGDELWRIPDCAPKLGSPILWTHAGKRYFLSAGPKRAVCVEPQTGEILWQIDPPAGEIEPLSAGEKPHPREGTFDVHILVTTQSGTPAVAGDVLVLPPNHGWSREGYAAPWQTGHSAWKLSPKGAKLMWRQPRRSCHSSYSATVIYRDVALLQSFKGDQCVLVDLLSGKAHGKVQGFGRGEAQGSAGDGWAFFGAARIRLDPDGLARQQLPVSNEPYVSSFYADGFLFTRGPVEGVPVDRTAIPTPPNNAVHCYDLRSKP